MFTKIAGLLVLLLSFSAHAKVKTYATLPELAWLVSELGGEGVEVKSFLSGSEDPHYVDASPAFVFKASRADLIVFNGLELETGWLPKVIQVSGNAKIQSGSKGHCDASQKVEKLETVADYDRSQGDLHPGGNPHYTLSPMAMIQAANSVKKCLEKFKVKNLEKNFKQLKEELTKLSKRSRKELSGLKNKRFMVYHREFSYFFKEFDLESRGSLEEVPGVLPSAGHLAKVAKKAKVEKVNLALSSSVGPKKYLEKFKELSGVDFIMPQIHPKRGEDYISFFDSLVARIIKHAK